MSTSNIEIAEGLLEAAQAVSGLSRIDVIMIYTQNLVPISAISYKVAASNTNTIEIPQHPVSNGLQISDTYIKKPLEIVIDAYFTTKYYLVSYIELKAAFDKVQKIIVQTLSGLYLNMYIEEIGDQTTNTAVGTLIVRIKCKQVTVVTQETTTPDKYKPRNDIDKSLTKNGSIVPQQMDEGSNLYRFFVKTAGS